MQQLRTATLTVRISFVAMLFAFGAASHAAETKNNGKGVEPSISHSLSDLWGVDEGVELYGTAGKFSNDIL